MARATYGSIITELKGSIGGHSFQQNSSGKIVRLKPWYQPKLSQLLALRQKNFEIVSQSWNALSLRDQSGWASFAAAHSLYNQYDELKTLTGYNFFQHCNCNLLFLNFSQITDNPSVFSQAAAPPFTILMDGNEIYSVYAGGVDFNTYSLIVFTTPPVPARSTKLRNLYKYTYHEDTESTPLTIITPAWQSTHGISYTPTDNHSNYRIGMLAFLVNKTTGIRGRTAFSIDCITPLNWGIGQMIIGYTFQIS